MVLIFGDRKRASYFVGYLRLLYNLFMLDPVTS